MLYNPKTKRYIADTSANRTRLGLAKKGSRKASRKGSRKVGRKASRKGSRKTGRKGSRKTSRKGSRKGKGSPQSFAGVKSNPFNKFFNKIYIINLNDKQDRFNKVTKQFIKQGIKYTRFTAIDGRCDKNIKGDCTKKRRSMINKYGVKIPQKMETAAASLVVGTREILKEQIKKGYKHILICEDDIEFGVNIKNKFAKGIEELQEEVPDWDVLYLGSGGESGVRGISQTKTAKNKYKTSLSIVDKNEYNWYVQHKNDLRAPCDKDDCEVISEHLTFPLRAGGGWCYAISLKGAKKIVRRLANVNNHADQIIPDMSYQGKLVTVAFDPPIVWHEHGAFRPDSTIPWEW